MYVLSVINKHQSTYRVVCDLAQQSIFPGIGKDAERGPHETATCSKRTSWSSDQDARLGGQLDPAVPLVHHGVGEVEVADAGGVVDVLGVDVVEQPLAVRQVVELLEVVHRLDGQELDEHRVPRELADHTRGLRPGVGLAVGHDDHEQRRVRAHRHLLDDLESRGHVGRTHVASVVDLAVHDASEVGHVDVHRGPDAVVERDHRDLAVDVDLQGEAERTLDQRLNDTALVVPRHRTGVIQHQHGLRTDAGEVQLLERDPRLLGLLAQVDATVGLDLVERDRRRAAGVLDQAHRLGGPHLGVDRSVTGLLAEESHLGLPFR